MQTGSEGRLWPVDALFRATGIRTSAVLPGSLAAVSLAREPDPVVRLAACLCQEDKLMFDPLSFNDFPAIMANASKEVVCSCFMGAVVMASRNESIVPGACQSGRGTSNSRVIMPSTVQAWIVTCGPKGDAPNQCRRSQGSHRIETWDGRSQGDGSSYKELSVRATMAPWHFPIRASRKQARRCKTLCVLNVSANSVASCAFRMLCDVSY